MGFYSVGTVFMTFDRSLWREWFIILPKWPCPNCLLGELKFESHASFEWEIPGSEKARKRPDWSPDWVVRRFSIAASCSNQDCGEGVVVTGVAGPDVDFDEDGNQIWVELYAPKLIYPASIPIDLPKKLPEEVINQIKRASAQIWIDFHACANCLRSAVEALLTHQKVRRQRKKKSGGLYRLNLSERIDEFRKKNEQAADLLHSIRVLGNVGSHLGKTKVTRDDVLDAFEIIEHVFSILYDPKEKQIAILAKKLKAKKK